MIVLGLLLAFLSNYAIAALAGGSTQTLWAGFEAYQWMFWVEILPASIFFLALFLTPESPRYLVAAGKPDKAQAILARLTNPRQAQAVIGDIKQTVAQKRKPKLADILVAQTGKIHPIIWAGIALAVLQQFTGINVVFYYGAVLWQTAGFSETDALLTNVISGSVNIVFTFLAIALIDRVGRKPLLMVGALGQAAMLGAMSIIFATGDLSDAGELQLSGTQGFWALLAANGYVAFFATTWGPVMWVMLGEMFPNRFRGAALAVCGVLHWLSNFAITLTFPVFLATLGLGVSYGIYAGFGLVAYFLVGHFVRETKGRTLEELSMAMQPAD